MKEGDEGRSKGEPAEIMKVDGRKNNDLKQAGKYSQQPGTFMDAAHAPV